MNRSHTPICWTPTAFTIALILLVGAAGPSFAASGQLERQVSSQPDVVAVPETGRRMRDYYQSPATQWTKSVEDPVRVPVMFQASFSSDLGEPVYADLAGVEVEGYPVVDFYGVTDLGQVSLQPNKTYTLYLTGACTFSASVWMSCEPLYRSLRKSGGDNNPARHYRIYFQSADTGDQWVKVCTGQEPAWSTPVDHGIPMAASFKIQVRPELGARPVVYPGFREAGGEDQADSGWLRDEPPMDGSTVIGDGSEVALSTPGELDPAAMRVEWSVSLGRLWTGTTAGRVRFDETRLTTNAYSPLALGYEPHSLDTNEVEVVHALDNTNRIAQIRVPQGLMTVDVLTNDAYRLRFFVPANVGSRDTNGMFTLSPTNATNFVSWQIDSGSTNGGTNIWRLQEMRNGLTNTSLVSRSAASGANTWTLSRGSGSQVAAHVRMASTVPVDGSTNRIEVFEVRDGQTNVTSRVAEVYRQFPWGMDLIATTNDPGGLNLVTKFTYFENDQNAATFGKIAQIEYPDGYWEKREYSDDFFNDRQPYGSLIRTIKPWNNTTPQAADNDCLVTDYQYPTTGPGSFEMVSWHDAQGFGEEPNNSSKTRSVVAAQAVQVTLDDCGADVLVTEGHNLGSEAIHMQGEYVGITSYGPEAGRLAGQLHHKRATYGALDTYDYEWGQWDATNRTFTVSPSGTDLRQTVYHGLDTTMGEGFGDTATGGESGNDIEDIILVPNQSTKEVRIVGTGNMVLRQTSVYQGGLTNFGLTEQVFYQRDCLGHATNVYRKDPLPTPSTGPERRIYASDWTGGGTWPTDQKRSEVDETGTVTLVGYDALKRPTSHTKLGASTSGYPSQGAVTNSVVYDAAGRTLSTTTAAGSLTLTTILRYDSAGRLASQVDPANLTNSFGYALTSGGHETTVRNSGGFIRTNLAYFDRRPASVTGPTVTNTFFTYSQTGTDVAKLSFWPKNIATLSFGTNTSTRIRQLMTDTRMVQVADLAPGFRSTNALASTNWFLGDQQWSTTRTAFEDQGGQVAAAWATWFEYDHFGRRVLKMEDGPDAEVTSDSGFAGTDRITTSTNYFDLDGQGRWFRVSEQWTYPWDNDATATLLQATKERLTGFASNEVSEVLQFDADTNHTTFKVTIDLANKKATTLTTVPQSSLTATQVVVNGLLQTESTPTVSQPAWHYYDALGREIAVKDPLGNVNGTCYNPSTGQVSATTNAFGLVTALDYYAAGDANAGLLKSQTGPTGKKTYFNYNPRGQLTQTWGDVPYPELRMYSQFGELTNLTTYRGGTAWTGSTWPTNNTGPTSDVTQWHYDESTGLLTNKVDALSRSVSFDYYNNHLPKSRFWARGVSSTNLYSANGDLVGIDYSDGTTNVVFTNASHLVLNRQAKPAFIHDASGDWTVAYDHAGRVLGSVATAGLLNGVARTNHFDPVKGRDRLAAISGGVTLRTDFASDSYGRLAGVTNGSYSATYAYRANSDLLETTTCRSNATTVLTTTRTWDTGPRLLDIRNVVSGTTTTAHGYVYDNLNRRTQANLEDGSLWQYAYNDRDELTSGRRFWPDWVPVAGQRFEYDYDNIGNREAARRGGNTGGGGLRLEDYTPNALNQYASMIQSNVVDVMGAAYATATVTVNGNGTSRHGEYFDGLLTVTNASGPVMQLVSSIATLAGQNTTNTGRLLVGPVTTSFAHDLDGNLTNDSTWLYRWDAENRLIQVSNVVAGTLAATNRLKLDFAYDFQGRRVQKVVSTHNGSGWVAVSTNRFVYDGWNLLAVLGPNQTPTLGFVWGQDLSGTMDQAGGIGGLLAVQEIGGGQVADANFAAYDGNGDVTALIKASDRTTSARYEYSPFGELLRTSGTFARTNPLRWSTKFADDETGLVYYGYRYLNPATGRWISRDPIEDIQEDNLYVFVLNRPIASVDLLGQLTLLDLLFSQSDDTSAQLLVAKRGLSIKNRIEEAVDAYSKGKQVLDVIMDASTGDVSGLLDAFLRVQNGAFGRALRGPKSAGTQYHHLLPQTGEFARDFGNALIDVDKFMVSMDRLAHQWTWVRRRGMRSGGVWNQAWREFFERYRNSLSSMTPQQQQEAIFKFSGKMLLFVLM